MDDEGLSYDFSIDSDPGYVYDSPWSGSGGIANLDLGDYDLGELGGDYGYDTSLPNLDYLDTEALSGGADTGDSSWFDTDGFDLSGLEDFDSSTTSEIPNIAKEGEVGYGWKYYDNGTAISPDGKYYHNGALVYDPASNRGTLAKLGSAGIDLLKKTFTDDKGNVNWKKVVGAGAGMLSAAKSMGWLGDTTSTRSQPRGYQGKIPTYQAVRSPVAGAFAPTKAGDPNRVYFSDLVYATPDKAAAAQAATQAQAKGLEALNPKPVTTMATGGLANLKRGTYLRGGTDGMADKLRTKIDGGQPAALSHGEFVVPADVVSHLGNGNSEAGAQRLYAMMDKVRQARTGTKKQGKQIDPNKYIPA
jgi:hypothetical protein